MAKKPTSMVVSHAANARAAPCPKSPSVPPGRLIHSATAAPRAKTMALRPAAERMVARSSKLPSLATMTAAPATTPGASMIGAGATKAPNTPRVPPAMPPSSRSYARETLMVPNAAMAITAASRAAGSRSPSRKGMARSPIQRERNVASRMACLASLG